MLSKYGTEAATVFDLLGRNEVDLTAALGWTLSHSPMMLDALIRHLLVRCGRGPCLVWRTGRGPLELPVYQVSTL